MDINYTVGLRSCGGYELDEVRRVIRQLLDDLGGLATWVKPGTKVVIKPNLLMRRKPDTATTTHPIVVEAVIKEVQATGGLATIAESPGGPYSLALLKSVYSVCGMTAVAERTGAHLNLNLDSRVVQNPSGLILKRIEIIKPLIEADLVINVCKLKTHQLTYMTGAVKNMFGAIPGAVKAEYHLRMPKMLDFSNLLVDVCQLVNPQLSIMDAIVGMEGPGPSGGNPVPVGALIASPNPFALDMVANELVGLDYRKVPTILRGQERGLCPMTQSAIKVVGEQLNSFRSVRFKPAVTRETLLSNKVPDVITSLLTEFMTPKPIFQHEACVGCGDCAYNCPPKVIEMKNGKPFVDLKHCIKCYCCQELCPVRAIEVKRTGPLAWLWRHN